MEFDHRKTDKKWQQYWAKHKTFKAENISEQPKFYILDMFPYPSGAGLHVGHPLGYIASDIYARYKKLKGFNVLHPMGYDAYGLPAEQYAIQTGTHPAVTTEKNIKRYREQMDKIGFAFDWDREVRTSDPQYYKWTQWTFIQLFNHWYDKDQKKARPIESLEEILKKDGNLNLRAATTQEDRITAQEWQAMDYRKQQDVLMNYRLAFLSDTWVNWCPELGTVLANDEVINGLSERGGHPVERKKMKQWSLRISAYAQRLLDGLETIDWSASIKEIQRNWIGRSEGATVFFDIRGHKDQLEIFTTRPDTLWGATFMVLAPEHEIVAQITTADRKDAVVKYIEKAKNKSERDRMAETKVITGEFTGAYGINPVNGKEIPIWVADYVLSGYGSGAIMAVPAHDSRDFSFARHFGLPIIQTVVRAGDMPSDPASWKESYDSKEGQVINSDFINGLEVQDAIRKTNNFLEENKMGFATINYRLRDAIFSRQRYWGEPFPVFYKDGIPHVLNESDLPLELPEINEYLPTESGEPPLARAKNWKTKDGYPLETNTMPGFAGSSGYYYRYMDPHNDSSYFSKESIEYWKSIDLYLGGNEHATGHLIYARFWSMFLFDLGLAVDEEPFKKLINQGKIQGRSSFVYRVNHEKYAEFLLWKFFEKHGMDKKVQRNFKDGNRRFDFFIPEENLIVEIKSQEKLAKLESYYKKYIAGSDKKLLMIPIYDIIYHMESYVEEIKQVIQNTSKGIIFDRNESRQLNPIFVSKNTEGRAHFSSAIHVDIDLVDNDILDVERFKQWRPEFKHAEFILEDDRYVCGWEIEKMSKSKHNVQNPDDLIDHYGADVFRMYEMFLGPIEHDKPWDTKGIEGVYRFIKKLRSLFFKRDGQLSVVDDKPSDEALKVLHKTIQKVEKDIEQFSFNTSVSQFMICVNELNDLGCKSKKILEQLLILISPFAPHIAEELWEMIGNEPSIANADFPEFNPEYIREDQFEFPVSFNGKMRFKINLPAGIQAKEAESIVLAHEDAQRWLEGKQVVKFIFVPKRIINIVIK